MLKVSQFLSDGPLLSNSKRMLNGLAWMILAIFFQTLTKLLQETAALQLLCPVILAKMITLLLSKLASDLIHL
jgi:hypothetical protein